MPIEFQLNFGVNFGVVRGAVPRSVSMRSSDVGEHANIGHLRKHAEDHPADVLVLPWLEQGPDFGAGAGVLFANSLPLLQANLGQVLNFLQPLFGELLQDDRHFLD
eukprot:SAG31_NODE_1946_length_6844_cov_5.947665_7_plen_106_part_00